MTKQELKMILKLIDKNSTTRYAYYNSYLEIDKEGIENLKQDIIDMFEESEK